MAQPMQAGYIVGSRNVTGVQALRLAGRRRSLLALVSLVRGKVLEHVHLLQQELEALVALLLLCT